MIMNPAYAISRQISSECRTGAGARLDNCARLFPYESHYQLTGLHRTVQTCLCTNSPSKGYEESAPGVHAEQSASALARQAAQAPSGVGGTASNQSAVADGRTDPEVAAPQHAAEQAAAGAKGAPGPMEHSAADVNAPSSAPDNGGGPAAPQRPVAHASATRACMIPIDSAAAVVSERCQPTILT